MLAGSFHLQCAAGLLAAGLLGTGLLGTGLLGTGCGGAQSEGPNFPPFTEAHEASFENGLDTVRDPDALGDSGDRWLQDWEDELEQRVRQADVIAVVRVRTLRTDIDLDRRETFRLIAHPERVLLGELDEEEVTLTSAEHERGYGTIETNESRILDTRFVAFIKWEAQDEGAPRARWHLSMATTPVGRRVQQLIVEHRRVRERDGTTRTVIVRHN